MPRLRRELQEATRRAVEQANAVTRQAVEDEHHNVMQYVDRLRAAFTQTAGGGWSANRGVGLILTGFLLQTASSVVSITSTP